MAFKGFPKQTFDFLAELFANNDKAWFDAHRDEYQQWYMEVAKEFVTAFGERINRFAPHITAEPAVNKSIFRINRDVRFSKDKTPYRDHLDLWFYPGQDRKAAGALGGYFFRLRADEVILGCGVHEFAREQLPQFQQAVAKQGVALDKLCNNLKQKGYQFGEVAYKKVPGDYDADHPQADLLRLKCLSSMVVSPLPKSIDQVEFLDWCEDHARALYPLQQWLDTHLC